MKLLVLDEVIEAIRGKVQGPVSTMRVSGVSTDSREVRTGDLFFAIPGAQMDGHRFVGEALRKGAVGAVVCRQEVGDDVPENGLLILVEDTIKALGRLGAYHRRLLAAQVIAVTGSNGKTTTKRMIDHILAGRMRGRASIKSFNNAIGVPLTLLSAEGSDEYLVVEVGTNAPGEVSALAALTEPDIAVITSVSECHLAGLGDLEGVAVEKLSLVKHLRSGGCAIVNTDAEVMRRVLSRKGGARVLTFGLDDRADLRMTDLKVRKQGLWFQVNGRLDVTVPVLGRHNAMNALGAMAVARRMGMADEEAVERLATFRLPGMRLEAGEYGGVTVINDAYNANPASMASAIQALEDYAARGRRICILGDMLELGEESARYHAALGERVGNSSTSVLVCVGEYARTVAQAAKRARNSLVARCHQNSTLAARAVARLVEPGDVVLVKGSRGVQMERVVEALARRQTANSTVAA